MLATTQLRLHKAVSNSVSVMEALLKDDGGKSIRNLDLQHDSLPTQRSLGVHWDLEGDAFTFKVVLPERPYTRRGVLSIINSVYDPLGLAGPVILRGKLLLRQLFIMGKKGSDDTAFGWDDPLPERLSSQWQSWRDALVDLEMCLLLDVTILRTSVVSYNQRSIHFQMPANTASELLLI